MEKFVEVFVYTMFSVSNNIYNTKITKEQMDQTISDITEFMDDDGE